MYQIAILYILNLYDITCQLCLNKAGVKKKYFIWLGEKQTSRESDLATAELIILRKT